jgi:hypothetical protein
MILDLDITFSLNKEVINNNSINYSNINDYSVPLLNETDSITIPSIPTDELIEKVEDEVEDALGIE